jgi:hypothetical protein
MNCNIFIFTKFLSFLFMRGCVMARDFLLFDMTILDDDWKKASTNMERYIRMQKVAKEKDRSAATPLSPTSTTSTSIAGSPTGTRAGVIVDYHFGVWLDAVYSVKENAAVVDVCQSELAKTFAFYSYNEIQMSNVLCILMKDKNVTIPCGIVAVIRHALGTPIGAKSIHR